jgi:hypothetical protein
MKLLLFTLCIITLQAQANELHEILLKRSATFEEREIVSTELKDLLGLEQPIPVMDAIAEICYNVDICATFTTNDQIEKECDPIEFGDTQFPTHFGSACYLKKFKEDYSCTQPEKEMSLAGIQVFSDLLNDTRGYYLNIVSKLIIKKYIDVYNVDLSIPENARAFMDAYPKEAKKLQSISNGAIALGSYTGNCYHQLNGFLFSTNTKKINRYYNLHSAIINTLDFFPDYKKKVNRGVNLPSSVLKEHHKVGNIVCYQGFTSTAEHNELTDYSSKPSNYFLSEKCTQRLYISYEDNNALPGKLIKSGSLSSNEKEVLFSPGSCFRIDKVSARSDATKPEDDDIKCEEGQHYNFEMTLVPAP